MRIGIEILKPLINFKTIEENFYKATEIYFKIVQV